MSLSLSLDGPGDAELISAVRGGDVDAYGELFARHVESARRLARQLAGAADADDLVSDAFAKVLTVLQRGGGPDLAFRAYLLTAVRRLHVDRIRAGSRLRPVDDLTPFDPGLPFQDTAVEGFDNAAAARAFSSLPERWQMVLWHTEVEQQKPADIAPLLGMSANSVSALAYRAREGLRQAFLSQHASDPDDIDCAWTRDHLGAYVRGGLSRRDAKRVDDHLAACRACAAVYVELTEVNSGLAGLIAPLLLGAAGAKYASSFGGGAAAGGAGSSGFAAAQAWAAAHVGLTAIGGLAVTATALFAVYGATHLKGHEAADVGSGAVNDLPSATSGASPTTGPGATSSHGTEQNVSPGATASPGLTGTDTSSPTTEASALPGTEPSSVATDSATTVTDQSPSPSDQTSTPPPGEDAITFTSVPPIDPVFGSTYRVQATSASGRSVSFSVDGTPANACSIDGDLVSFDHAGTCVITATVTTRNAARVAGAGAAARTTSKVFSQTVVIPKGTQKIDYHGDPAVDGPALTATGGGSGQDVRLSTETPNVCSVNDAGTKVTFQHAQTCTVVAHQDGNEDFKPVDDRQSFDVAKGDQTVVFSRPDAGQVGTTGTLEATSSAGLHVTFTPAGGHCTVQGSTVTFVHTPSCTIVASAGNNDYKDASDTQTIDVAKGVQTVTFAPVGGGQVGTSDPLHATSSAGLDVTFSTTDSSCSVSGDRVSYQHASPCTVTASAGNDDYKDASDTQTIDVAKGDPTLDFTPVTGAEVGTDSRLQASSDSDGAITFGTTDDSCTVTGSTVHFTHARPCVVTAEQAASADWNAATADQTIDIAKGDQTITFTSTPPTPALVGGSYLVSATGGGSGNAVTFGSSTPLVCTVKGSTVSFLVPGSCSITADQLGTDDYAAAPTATQTFTVSPATDMSLSAVVSDQPPLPDHVWHEVDVTVHDLAVGGTATVSGSSSTPGVLVVPQFNCWFQKDGVCHVSSPPTTVTVKFYVLLPASRHDARVTFTAETDDSPDPDPSNDTVTVTVREFDD